MRFVFALVLLFSAQAYAATDYACMSSCQSAGMLYGLCKSKCSYGESSGGVDTSMYNTGGYQVPKIKQTDYGCVNSCTSQGFLYGLCKERCSY